MKINFLVFRPGIDGGARVITQHAKYLQAAGHEVTILSLGAKRLSLTGQLRSLKQGRFMRRIEIHPQLYHDAGLKLVLFDQQDALSPDDIPDADITIATWWETAEWLAPLPESKGVKVHFIQGHEATLPHGQSERAAAVYSLPAKRIVVSQWLKNILLHEYGVEDCVLVENGVDTRAFQAGARKKQASPTVGFVFSVTNVKNSSLAIDACDELRRRKTNLELFTFGSVKPHAYAPLPEWIPFQLRPSQARIAEIYSQCDVWLFTSREEGFGLPILESMACGTPVVATRAGAAAQIVTDACGSLVEMNAAAVADAAERYLDMPEDAWRAASGAARERAELFDVQKAGAAFESALLEFARG